MMKIFMGPERGMILKQKAVTWQCHIQDKGYQTMYGQLHNEVLSKAPRLNYNDVVLGLHYHQPRHH